jgi:hypothetical protein
MSNAEASRTEGPQVTVTEGSLRAELLRRHTAGDLYLNPQQLADMQRWSVDEIDETTRQALWDNLAREGIRDGGTSVNFMATGNDGHKTDAREKPKPKKLPRPTPPPECPSPEEQHRRGLAKSLQNLTGASKLSWKKALKLADSCIRDFEKDAARAHDFVRRGPGPAPADLTHGPMAPISGGQGLEYL